MTKNVTVNANTVTNVNLGASITEATGLILSVFNEGTKEGDPSFHGCQLKVAASQPTEDQMYVDAQFLPDYRFSNPVVNVASGTLTLWAYFKSGKKDASITLTVESI